MKYLVLLIALFSFNTFAGYQCNLSLSENDQIEEVIASKTVFASEKDLRSEIFEDFSKGLVLKVFIDGWAGEEEMSAAIYSKHAASGKLELISEKVSLRGNDKETLWFDSFKLNVSCSLA